MKSLWIRGLAYFLAVFAVTVSVSAGEVNEIKDEWSFKISPYLWAIGMDGDVTVKGNESKIVVLSLVWGAPDHQCGPPPGTEKLGQRVMDFTNMFTHGFVGRICDDFGPYFTEAVSVVGGACDGFVPPQG